MAMELDQFLSEIFPHKDREINATPRRLLEYSSLQEHIEEILEQYEKTDEPATAEPEEKALTDGRIGPEFVGVDRNSLYGSMNVKEGIEVESQSNFSSVRANVCVCKGKWMYEILLGSKGIMQLGWATLKCEFTNEEGVGDTAHSFAYDGHRVRKWNVTTAKYGEEWMAGDVIGCSIDLDEGTIAYTRNGKDLGVAFNNVKFGPGLAYFPAVSLSYGESCQLNFGTFPFKYPVEGYKPLQDPPVACVAKAKELIGFLNNLLPAPDRTAQLPSSFHCKADTITLVTTAHVFEKLSPLLIRGYVVEEVLLPFLLTSCSGGNPMAHQPGAHKILDLMWACMEEYELEPCLDHLLYALIKAYWYKPVTMDFKDQMHSLSLVLNILRHERTRRIWIKSKMCPQKFSYFMHIRPPDDHVLKSYFPVVWWDSEDESSQPNHGDKEEYLSAAAKLKMRVQVLETVQVEMCKILLRDDEDQSQSLPSTRKVFLEKFRKFLQENMSTTMTAFMQPQPSSACTGPVVTCFYHRLIQALRWHWDKRASDESLSASSIDAYVPYEKFYNDDIQYWDISRLGGLLSHLKKTRADAIKKAGTKVDSAQSSKDQCHEKDHEAIPDHSLVEMLDGIYMLYHIAVHKQFSKVRAVKESMQQNIKALEETMVKIRQCSAERADVLTELQRSKRVFMEEAKNCARHMAWVSNLIFTKEKQRDLHWMLFTLLGSLERATTGGALFEFTPEFYIEVAINSFHALRSYYHSTIDFQNIPDAASTLDRMASFLCTHFTDQRIINPDLKDVIIQSLATFVCHKDSLNAVEKMSEEIQKKTLRSLMAAYDKRSWVQTTWILVRVWKGCGFAFRYTSPHDIIALGLPEHAPCFSRVLQQQLAKLSLHDNSLANEFLNGVLNQLNWAFSEFIGMLQEIQQATNRMETVLDTRQLRSCAVCFDLTVGLLRVLEMVSTVAPELFTDWKRGSAELHIARLFQLLTQVLNRVTSSGNLFENVIRLRLPGLETVDRFPVLGAVTGIMLALLLQGTTESKERATSALLAEPGFHLESVEFLIGGKPKAMKSSGSFSFKSLLGKDVREDEVEMVEKLVTYLERESSQALLQKQESVDVDELCPICCAVKKSVKFLPCGHVSCRSCITRHLMNNKECFFCKMAVTEVVSIDHDADSAETSATSSN